MVVGQTVQNLITAAVGLLILAGIMVGVGAFQTQQQNQAKDFCNSTVHTKCGAAVNLTQNIGDLTQNFGAQLGTVGVMFGVGLIIAAIAVLSVGLMNKDR